MRYLNTIQIHNLFIFLAFCSINFLALAQSDLNRAYTKEGIGELQEGGSVRDQGLGATIANPNPLSINISNPSLLTSNPFTSFEFSIKNEFRKSSDVEGVRRENNLGFQNLVFSFPLVRSKWQMAFQVNQFSKISYLNISDFDLNDNDSLYGHVWEEGLGGINQLGISNGFTILKKLNVGFSTSLLLGNAEHENTIFLNRLENDTVSDLIRTSKLGVYSSDNKTVLYRGFKHKVGISYTKELDSSNVAITIGATYDLNSRIKGINTLTETRNIGYGTSRYQQIDTLQFKEEESLNTPQVLGLGIGVLLKKRFSASLDYKLVQLNGNSNTQVAVGFEKLPSRSPKSVFGKSFLQLGGYYKQNYLYFNSEGIDEVGINFGISIPKSGSTKRDPFSLISTSVVLGTHGEKGIGMVKESFIKLNFGLTFNNSWFNKIRIN